MMVFYFKGDAAVSGPSKVSNTSVKLANATQPNLLGDQACVVKTCLILIVVLLSIIVSSCTHHSCSCISEIVMVVVPNVFQMKTRLLKGIWFQTITIEQLKQ